MVGDDNIPSRIFRKILSAVILAVFIINLCGSLDASAMQKELIGKRHITDGQELEDVKTLYYLAHDLEHQEAECRKRHKDRSECICGKRAADYLKFDDLYEAAYDKYYADWFLMLLVFDDNGQTIKTSLRAFMDIEDPLVKRVHKYCRKDQRSGEYVKTYPSLRLVDDDDIYDIRRLGSYRKKIEMEIDTCLRGGYSEAECQCGLEDDYELLRRVLELTVEKHPEWENKKLRYSYRKSHYGESGAVLLDSYKAALEQFDQACISGDK